jgi:hypothetical protein
VGARVLWGGGRFEGVGWGVNYMVVHSLELSRTSRNYRRGELELGFGLGLGLGMDRYIFQVERLRGCVI